MVTGGFLGSTVEEMLYVIMRPRAEVREGMKRGAECPGHKQLKAAIVRHPAMLYQNHTPGFLPSQDGNTQNPLTCWRRKGTSAPPPDQRRQRTPEPMPPLPGTPPAPTGNNCRAQHSHIDNLPARYVYSYSSLNCAESFTLDAYAQDSQHHKDFNPDMLTDEGTSTA